jgi:hypothetical protein
VLRKSLLHAKVADIPVQRHDTMYIPSSRMKNTVNVRDSLFDQPPPEPYTEFRFKAVTAQHSQQRRVCLPHLARRPRPRIAAAPVGIGLVKL